MKKPTDKTQVPKARRLALRKEILRNLGTADLAQVVGAVGPGGTTNGGPCPRSKCEP
jgi:hypothetical protein